MYVYIYTSTQTYTIMFRPYTQTCTHLELVYMLSLGYKLTYLQERITVNNLVGNLFFSPYSICLWLNSEPFYFTVKLSSIAFKIAIYCCPPSVVLFLMFQTVLQCIFLF